MAFLTLIKITFLRLITPVQKLMQKLGRAETIMTKAKVDAVVELALPGDILLSKENQRLTSMFIKGKYKHAAIVGANLAVIEAVGAGVQEVPLVEWLYKKDYVALIRRVPGMADDVNLNAAKVARTFLGIPYDFTFSLGDSRIYCSELIYLCYSQFDKAFADEINHDDILPTEYRDLCFTTNYMHLIYET